MDHCQPSSRRQWAAQQAHGSSRCFPRRALPRGWGAVTGPPAWRVRPCRGPGPRPAAGGWALLDTQPPSPQDPRPQLRGLQAITSSLALTPRPPHKEPWDDAGPPRNPGGSPSLVPPLTPLKGPSLAPVTQLPTWARGGGRQGQRASAQARTAAPHCPPRCPEQDPRPDTEGQTAGHHPHWGALLGCLETWALHPTTAPGDGSESLAQLGAIHEGRSCPLAWTQPVAFGQWGLCFHSRGT